MRGQWGLITALIIMLFIAIFAVINVEPVQVNYLVGESEWPLVLVIIGSVLMGGLIVGGVGMYKIYRLQQEVKQLKEKLPKNPLEDIEKQDENFVDKKVSSENKSSENKAE